MTKLQSPAVAALVLRRTYSVPPERVFAAWTNPEIAARFLSAGDATATVIHMDVKIGGTFSIAMDSPENGRFVAKGTYLEVNAPKRLVMTWRWEEDDPAEEYDSLLSLDFHERNGETEFVLTHEKLASVESRARHEEGWTSIIDQLATVLEAS
jgi:uncharacterized protein YndB with AHSA1/START domain